MKYALDTNIFIAMTSFYPEIFPTFWENLNRLVSENNIISTEDNFFEYTRNDFIKEWVQDNKSIFEPPNKEESAFIQAILSSKNFRANIEKKKLAKDAPHADPFLIAKAKVSNATVVTLEKFRENSANIPNICEHFSIKCINLETFIKQQKWIF